MRLARYEFQGTVSYGVVEEESVRALTGDPFGSHTIAKTATPLSRVKLLAPCEPKKALAMAYNYCSHLGSRPVPTRPQLFLKASTCIVGTGDAILLPKDFKRVDPEGELVMVIGKRCKDVSEQAAWGYIFGYTCGNDLSEREWQNDEDKDAQWWRAKSSDTFGPIGPWIETDFDPLKAQHITRVNGEEKQRQFTTDQVFNVPQAISFASRYMTLEPGDIIFMGTPRNTSPLKAGDVVEVDIPGIGVLRNPVG